jgi:hypothetical protein
MGADGRALVEFKSVAVPSSQFASVKHKKVQIQGMPYTFEVDDSCPGGGCKTFDIFLGSSVSKAKCIPNWQAGNIPIKYRYV